MAILRGHAAAVAWLAFSPDGSRLASADAARLIAWDPASGTEALVTQDPAHRHLTDLAIGRGRFMTTIAGHRLIRRDAESGRASGAGGGDGPEGDVLAASPDGGLIAFGRDDGTIALVDASGQTVRDLSGHGSRVTALSFSGHGQTPRFRLRRQDGAGLAGRCRAELARFESELAIVPAVALSPSGDEAAWGGDHAAVVVRPRAVRCARAPDRGRGWSRTPALVQCRWDMAGRVALARPGGVGPARGKPDDLARSNWVLLFALKDQPAGVTDAAFAPDGSRLAAADRAGEVRVFEATTWRLLLVLRGPSGPISRVAFSPDGHRILAAGGRIDSLARPRGNRRAGHLGRPAGQVMTTSGVEPRYHGLTPVVTRPLGPQRPPGRAAPASGRDHRRRRSGC